MPNDKAFRAFPITKLECVAASTDDKSNGIGCGLCEGNSLQYSLKATDWYKTCKLTSYDGLSTAYCSQKDDGNKPTIVTSCYQGTFTTEAPLQPSECGADEFNTDNGNSQWCTVS